MEIVWATIRLYEHAFRRAVRSFIQCWVMTIAIIVFAILMMVLVGIAGAIGFLGGFILGAANAFAVGWTLSIVEQAVKGSHRMGWMDIWESAGHYFGDVITLGFIIWVPLQLLEMGMPSNPSGPALISAIFFLLFILLNPIPEVIYQGRHGSPLEAIKDSYDFVIENWIEWFLPLAVVLAPLGLTFFFGVTSRGGRLIGLDFFQLIQFPFIVLTRWFHYIGVSSSLASFFILILTPITTVFILLFRGHLFASLSGTSRRQRIFQAKAHGGSR